MKARSFTARGSFSDSLTHRGRWVVAGVMKTGHRLWWLPGRRGLQLPACPAPPQCVCALLTLSATGAQLLSSAPQSATMQCGVAAGVIVQGGPALQQHLHHTTDGNSFLLSPRFFTKSDNCIRCPILFHKETQYINLIVV